MFKSAKLVITGLLFFISVAGIAQSAKKHIEAAQKFEKAKNYNDAIESYSKALELDPENEKAFVARAQCYEKVNRKPEAIEDYKRAMVFAPKEKELYYNAGRLFADLGQYKEADEMLKKALERDKRYTEAIRQQVDVHFRIADYKQGLVYTQMALDDKKTAQSYFDHAVMLDSLHKYEDAEKFYRESFEEDAKFIAAAVGLSAVQLKLSKNDDAMKSCNEALAKNAGSNELLVARSRVYAAKKDLQAAINDVTKVILTKADASAYKLRASYYEALGQHITAVGDYSQVLVLDEKDVEAYLKRAQAHEHMQNFKAALKDYNKVQSLAAGNAQIESIVAQAQRKIFELNREQNKPEVEITSVKTDKSVIKISSDRTSLQLKGRVKDASLVKNIVVNSGNATFSPDTLNPEFVLDIKNVDKLNEITISVTDVYNNTGVAQYKLEKTESDKPIIAIEAPIASFENEIFIDNTNPEIYLQGKIKDASLIETIMVDGLIASYNPSQQNPAFSTVVNIAEKTSINIVVRDIYGNTNEQVFTLNRSGATAAIDNPMGNTWVVFIENSKYLHFPSLEGPAKDVTAMKSALANYKITKVLHKRDMSKQDMEKFFSIELRDYVRNNNVNSLLIWYAGHGKYVSPTGYWVPSDGKTDDEFSYFGINNLKASMQSYSDRLVHTLVITDACESGATFLMAMRGGEDDKRCDNFELTRAKSAQVFTSAGYELASDNSQFTKTFVSCLNNNVEMCLPIEKIVKRVSSAVTQAGNQTPKFGKIKDLVDEGGTYFFIKK